MMGFVRRHPLLCTHAASLLVLGGELVFFSLSSTLGRDEAGRVQPFVLPFVGLAALLWLFFVRFCYGRPGTADLAWGIIGLFPPLCLAYLIVPEYACNAGRGCM